MTPLPRVLRGRDLELPRVLTVVQARALGMTDHAIEHAVSRWGWRRLTRGILFTDPGEPTRADWINVGLVLAGPAGAIGGWDAVRLVGIGSTEPPRAEVLVLARSGAHRVVGRVRIRPTARPYATWSLPGEHPDHPYERVANTARAVADTALQYRRFAPVRALVTSAIQRQLCEIEDLARELDNGPRNGSAWLRRALLDVRDGAKSIAEADALDVLRSAPLPPFEANVPIVTASGILMAEADCLWRQLRAVMEIDSREFHFSEADWNATRRRHNELGRHGLAVVHYSPAEVRRAPSIFATEVEQWLRARAAELGVPYRPVRHPLQIPPVPGKPEPFIVADLRA